ncbi:hypothetical protein G6L05_33995 [Agrobacterium rhizogenes]|nr:hypothetical protein [Rhizobium rhizogenes]
MLTEAIFSKKILIFLPPAAARVIATKLEEQGYMSAAVSTVPEAFDALRSDCYSFVVATRPDIALLRNIRSIPVLNLEIFFHTDPSTDGPSLGSKRFDSRKFMERVELLARSEAERRAPAEANSAPPAIVRGDQLFELWSSAKTILGFNGRREG